LNCICLFDINR